MSAHVLLNLLNELGKRDKMRGFRALGNAELRVLVRTFFPWDACLSLGESSAYACFFSRHALKIQ